MYVKGIFPPEPILMNLRLFCTVLVLFYSGFGIRCRGVYIPTPTTPDTKYIPALVSTLQEPNKTLDTRHTLYNTITTIDSIIFSLHFCFMSALDNLIKRNPNILNLVRRFDLVETRTTTIQIPPPTPPADTISTKISNRVRSLINSLKTQYP